MSSRYFANDFDMLPVTSVMTNVALAVLFQVRQKMNTNYIIEADKYFRYNLFHI